MQIEAKYFGLIDIDESAVITMAHPIYGFEHLQKYALLHDEEIGSEIVWLQSLDEPAICFVLANLFEVMPTYQPMIREELLKQLEGETEDVLLFAILVIADEFVKSTANLKSPIIINSNNRLGAQIILDDEYPLRHSIFLKEGCE